MGICNVTGVEKYAVPVFRRPIRGHPHRDAERAGDGDRPTDIDLVADAVEVPCAVDLPGDVRRAGNRPLVPVSAQVLHPPIEGESLHVVLQPLARGWGKQGELADLCLRQDAVKEIYFIDLAVM